MIKVTNLSKSFDETLAVNSLSMVIKPGDIVGFLGPNGAGKSTTMKMLTGFLSPSQGEIEIDGLGLSDNRYYAQANIGYLPEGAPCYGELTVYQFLDFVADCRGLTDKSKQQRIKLVVSQLNLTTCLNKPIEKLSKGFKRRVGIAQALIHDPKILILDEPTDGLDPNQKHQIRELIAHLARDKTIIISTHILEEVSAVCNRVIIIDQGRMIFDGTPNQLEAKDPNHQVINITFTNEVLDYAPLATLGDIHEISNLQILLKPFVASTNLSQVWQIIQQHNWSVCALYQQQGQLDQVFRLLTQTVERVVPEEVEYGH